MPTHTITHLWTVTHINDNQFELFCPTCGRYVIVTHSPFKWEVKEQGDQNAAHKGETGGFMFGNVWINQKERK